MSDPRLTEVSRRLAASRRELEGAVASVPPDLRQTSPGEGRWSVAQVLEHLGMVETSLTRAIEGLVQGAPGRDDGERFDAAAFSATLDLPLVLDRSRPRTASEGAQPTAGMDTEAALRRLGETRRALLDVLDRGAGRALEQSTREHPVLGDAGAYRWASFVAYHEARHAAQIREIGDQLTGAARKT